MNPGLINILVYLSIGSIVIPLALGLFKFRSKPRYLKILGFLIILSGLSDLFGYYYRGAIIISGNIWYRLKVS